MIPELSPGARLGQYQIEDPLGSGGMGTVYRATDTKLGRPVALKLLHLKLLEDGSAGLARFEREARALAALNHSRVAAIYGFEQHGSVPFLVLEYVPGETLSERLRRGPLPVKELVSFGKQIAEGLEAAHARNLIHRDLKPANIKVGENGQIKILDFGLAKSVEGPREVTPESPTATLENLTQKMETVGTPAYMSPEQACGKEVDTRTDIWAFGCVLYEALSGKQAFRGKTITEIVAAVVEREPEWTVLPAATPVALVTLLKRCLRKDRDHRLHSIADARLELEDLQAASGGNGASQPAVTRRAAIAALSGAAAGAAATGIFAISRYRSSAPRNLTRFAIEVPDGRFHNPSFNKRVAISPNGAHLAFAANLPDGLATPYLRSLNALESKLQKDLGIGAGLFFSPDSQWVACSGDAAVKKLALSGGAAEKVCSSDSYIGGCWCDNGNIYFVPEFPSGLAVVPAAGGDFREVLKIDFDKGERNHRYPCAIPGSETILLTTAMADSITFDDARIIAFSPKTGRTKVLIEGGMTPRYSPSGHLLYARAGKVYAVRFDPSSLQVTGQPFPVLDGVLMSRNTGCANYDVSASGDLFYVPGICDGGARTLDWVDRSGKSERVTMQAKSYLHPRLDPDDRLLAIEIEGPSHDLYVYDFERGVLSNITTNGVSHWPVWSPDGKKLSYRSGPMTKFQMWQVPADRSSPPAKVPATGVSQSAESWSPDGRAIAYTAVSRGVPPRVMVTYVDGGKEAQEFAAAKAPVGSSKFSPDGHWLAYCSNESGKAQVYVQAFPGPGAKIQISSDGGTDPVWRRSGGELYYRNGDSMMAVTISTASGFSAGRPQELWKGHYSHGMSSSCGAPGATSSNYDVTADGKRFLMIKDDDMDRARSRQMIVVQGWADEVRRLSASS